MYVHYKAFTYNAPNEPAADRVHERRRSPRLLPLLAEELNHTVLALQLRHVNVPIHPVDAFHFQHDVIR
jgi:hypothetical protein